MIVSLIKKDNFILILQIFIILGPTNDNDMYGMLRI